MPSDLLAHRVEGEGEPVLLLNGGLMTCASWDPVAARLATRHEIVRCDLRGQLLSPGEPPSDLTGNVDDLVELLDHLEIDAVHVVGTSYGGEIGLLAAALIPERVRSLVAATVSDYATEAIRKGAEDLRRLVHAALEGGDRRLIHDRLVEEVYSPGYLESHREELAARREQFQLLPERWLSDLEGILSAVAGMDVRPFLSDIRCPTLIVIAADDRSIPPARSLALAAGIARSVIRTHPSSGHALVAEDPEWLASVTLDFLSGGASAVVDSGTGNRIDEPIDS